MSGGQQMLLGAGGGGVWFPTGAALMAQVGFSIPNSINNQAAFDLIVSGVISIQGNLTQTGGFWKLPTKFDFNYGNGNFARLVKNSGTLTPVNPNGIALGQVQELNQNLFGWVIASNNQNLSCNVTLTIALDAAMTNIVSSATFDMIANSGPP